VSRDEIDDELKNKDISLMMPLFTWMFFKCKRCGKIKTRGYGDCPQLNLSPKMNLVLLMCQCSHSIVNYGPVTWVVCNECDVQ